jgi:hypothetical protein
MNDAQNEQQQGVYTDAQINQGSQIPPSDQPGVYDQGYEKRVTPDFNRKSPVLATLLSLMPGLGQAYVGYYTQGFINIAAAAGMIAILASSFGSGIKVFVGVFIAFFWIFQMIDANRRAYHYNRVKAGLGGEKVPEGFEIPSSKGSILGGIVLVLVGILFILDLNFNVSMEWIENWWPVILILAGVNLVYKARKNTD